MDNIVLVIYAEQEKQYANGTQAVTKTDLFSMHVCIWPGQRLMDIL